MLIYKDDRDVHLVADMLISSEADVLLHIVDDCAGFYVSAAMADLQKFCHPSSSCTARMCGAADGHAAFLVQKPGSMHNLILKLNHVSISELIYAVLLQEQAQAARKRAAGIMDEYTFITEDGEAADQAGSVPALQQVSAEELYRKELAEEMQVQLQTYSWAAALMLCVNIDLVPVLPAPPHCRTGCTQLQHMHALCTFLCHSLLCFTAASWLTTQTHEEPCFDVVQYHGNM